MLNVAICYAECHYAECRLGECHYAECRLAECHHAECRGAVIGIDIGTNAEAYCSSINLIKNLTKLLESYTISEYCEKLVILIKRHSLKKCSKSFQFNLKINLHSKN